FSALCSEWIKIYGEQGLELLIMAAKSSNFLLSDLLPYKNKLDDNGNTEDCDIYMPKPAIIVDRDVDRRYEMSDSVSKKKMKKMTHISIGRINDYLKYLKSGGKMDFGMDPSEIFAQEQVVRVSRTYEKEPLPYQVASVIFKKDAGLCFIAKIEDEIKEQFDIVIDSLGTTGIGGKRSSGYGKFELDEDELEISEEFSVYESDRILASMLEKPGKVKVSLSCILPDLEDASVIAREESYYQLIMRKGFIYSSDYSNTNQKKKQLIMLKSGACLSESIKGSIADVSDGGNHSVYRYGKGMFLGVNL
ncbi:MAG TPA: type III-A CRISPR-associated RAMP protein Csm4, partial [Tissierellaceae bacterium]|nr:type III-A CRISPR-associated RAMP protein Csm4 [Tissierellaceae bacterium]